MTPTDRAIVAAVYKHFGITGDDYKQHRIVGTTTIYGRLSYKAMKTIRLIYASFTDDERRAAQ